MQNRVAKREGYFDWDETFMLMTELISQRSKDPNTQTGACVVNTNNVVVGLGYNGWARGIKDEDLSWNRETKNILESKYTYVVHAETNAILNSNSSTKNCKIYVNLFPCNECAKIIIQSGITEVIYKVDKYFDQDIFIASRKMLTLAKIKLRQYKPAFKLTFIKENGK